VRVRLTAVYSGLFLATSTALLVTMNLVLRINLQQRINALGTAIVEGPQPGLTAPPPGVQVTVRPDLPRPDIQGLTSAVVRYQWAVTGIVIAVLTLASVAIGWWLAGRVLNPLHRIIATARRLSLANLDERIALTGPRDELTELADTFDAMLDRLQVSADSQRRFVANASHELRTPLAIQRAAIQIGLKDPSPQKLARVRAQLLEVNRRSERLIDGLLLLAQGEHGLETAEPIALDVLVREVANETPADGVEIRQNVEPATVTGDPVLMNRLVANLVHNAIRYNRPGGVVDVHLTIGGRLTISNTGPKVPEDRVSELFEPFRRLNTDRTRSADGVGLGLSIVASIARAHYAVITAQPNPEGGLEVTVQFRPPAREEATGVASIAAGADATPVAPRRRTPVKGISA
jgi:signal transduction histidine kinase